MEILKVLSGRKLDVVFACVGGGGLLSGIAAYIKALRPEVRVIGVEADDAAGILLECSFKAIYILHLQISRGS